jgi:hypothetical protein
MCASVIFTSIFLTCAAVNSNFTCNVVVSNVIVIGFLQLILVRVEFLQVPLLHIEMFLLVMLF